MTLLTDQITHSLRDDNTDVNRQKWAHHIVRHKIAIMDLADLIYAPHPVGMRFSWVLGNICEQAPAVIYPSFAWFFLNRKEIRIPNFERSLAKMFWLSGVPSEIEGEAINEMFKWIMDAGKNVTIKTNSLLALYELTGKYPDLKNELKIVIEDQKGRNRSSFEKQAKIISLKL